MVTSLGPRPTSGSRPGESGHQAFGGAAAASPGVCSSAAPARGQHSWTSAGMAAAGPCPSLTRTGGELIDHGALFRRAKAVAVRGCRHA
jgi:hypothetical protein